MLNSIKKQIDIFEQLPIPVIVIDNNKKVEQLNKEALIICNFDNRGTSIINWIDDEINQFVDSMEFESKFKKEFKRESDVKYYEITLKKIKNFKEVSDNLVILMKEINGDSLSNEMVKNYQMDINEKELKYEVLLDTFYDYFYMVGIEKISVNDSRMLPKKISDITNKINRMPADYDKFKNEFFANISHELRTPLNVILSSIQLMDIYVKNNSQLTGLSKMLKYKDVMKRNCYRLTRLINNLIDVIKMDVGCFELSLEPCDIVKLVENVIVESSKYVRRKNIEFEFNTDIDEKIMVIDRNEIERVILNLISNSVKFTKEYGKISVEIHGRRDFTSISVKDTGIGIPKDKIKYIFGKFTQVNKTLVRENEGAGIGLSIVDGIVKMHGGSIRVKSECNKGSEFLVNIPVGLPAYYKESAITCEGLNRVNNNYSDKVNMEFSDIYFM